MAHIQLTFLHIAFSSELNVPLGYSSLVPEEDVVPEPFETTIKVDFLGDASLKFWRDTIR
jgi:hypothetical protein